LYAEKLSGTAFTAPRHSNKQSWLYRIIPAAAHGRFAEVGGAFNAQLGTSKQTFKQIPNQIRWDPFALDPEHTFVDGLKLVAGAGDPQMKSGLGIYIYAAGKDMGKQGFYNADGDFLIVPQLGSLEIQTELGKMLVRPNEICVIPRGIRFRVELPDRQARGYILEVYSGHFELPDLGPIGSNGLANVRDFQIPQACYENEQETKWTLLTKFDSKLFSTTQDHSPFDVVGWHGMSVIVVLHAYSRQLLSLQVRSWQVQHHWIHQLRPS
jgi:homogentisate 1,2-dioxygenase